MPSTKSPERYFCPGIYIAGLLFFLVSPPSYSQLRAKVYMDVAAGNDDLYNGSFGLNLEQKLDPNKAIITGLGVHFLFYDIYSNNDMGFHKSFIENTPLEQHSDSISYYTINAVGLNIPLGYNYYLTPKLYLDYTLNFNFILASSHSGVYVTEDEEEIDVYEFVPFEEHVFKAFYTAHTISVHRVFFRRAEAAIGWHFTFKSNILNTKGTNGAFLEELNSDFSKFSLLTVGFKWYLFQIKSMKI